MCPQNTLKVARGTESVRGPRFRKVDRGTNERGAIGQPNEEHRGRIESVMAITPFVASRVTIGPEKTGSREKICLQFDLGRENVRSVSGQLSPGRERSSIGNVPQMEKVCACRNSRREVRSP